jgi:type I restriction enzyme R subunit
LRSERNLVQGQAFSEKLKRSLNVYHIRAFSTTQMLEELIALAKEFDAAGNWGESLDHTDDEVAFYDALAAHDSAM